MNRRTADLIAAPLIASWAIVVLPGWALAERLMTSNSMLILVEGIAGLVVFGVTALITFGSLGLAIGLLMGAESARLPALTVGCASALTALTMALAGEVPAGTHPFLLAGWWLALVGGPTVAALMVAGGELLPPPRRRRPAPPSLPATPLLTATAEDYWVQVASRPAPQPADLPDEPWWTDLDTAGWILVALGAGAIMFGVYWLGGRWRSGPHPIGGLLLIVSAIGMGWGMDRARSRARR